MQVINKIGPKQFSAISSDSTGNTRLARELLAKDFPWIIILPDPCHHMHNCAKDICSLVYFEETILQLRMVIQYFCKSTFAAHHLLVLRLLWNIPRGLIRIGNTRFLCIYYAIHALLPCLRPINELVNSGVLKVTQVCAILCQLV